MYPQLQNSIDPSPRFLFQFLQRVDIPWVKHYRLLADCVRAGTQCTTNMRIMQIIRAANRDIVHTLFVTGAPQLLDMPVETLVFGEESAVVK
jgi:hypothetical protein